MGWISVALVLAVGCTPPQPPLVPVPSGLVQSLDYSSDGRLLACAGGNGIGNDRYNLVRIWDRSCKELRVAWKRRHTQSRPVSTEFDTLGSLCPGAILDLGR